MSSQPGGARWTARRFTADKPCPLPIPEEQLLCILVSRQPSALQVVQGHLDLYLAFEPSAITIAGQMVPLEADTSTACAFSLSNPQMWASDIAGFFAGNVFHAME